MKSNHLPPESPTPLINAIAALNGEPHPIHYQIYSQQRIVCFCEMYIFIVWDFFNLARRVSEWLPSQLVEAQEPLCNLYLEGLREIGGDLIPYRIFSRSIDVACYVSPTGHLPTGISQYLERSLHLSRYGDTQALAASFFLASEPTSRPLKNWVRALNLQSNSLPTALDRFHNLEQQKREQTPEILQTLFTNSTEVNTAIITANQHRWSRRIFWDTLSRILKKKASPQIRSVC